ncbi:hypothetical protein [Methylobacterium aquaticum]|uniref:hypothetical protein n=1 Tax=Methylobacterium aquaticum TaxID=270351 RepID=UPI0019333765|nr:hypothetical protein [Methylobacterium aquaticum]QRE76839.1 helix-turn-helix domain-containing protein [Methylobacterium aquaticum]
MSGGVRAPDEDVRAALEAAIEKAGSAGAWARQVGLSPGYVSDVRLRRRALGPALLDALGVERVTTVLYVLPTAAEIAEAAR